MALSGLAVRASPARLAIYELLLASPGTAWTVASLAARLAPGSPVSLDTVRATLYVLAEQGAVRAEHSGTALTFRLPSEFEVELRSVVTGWQHPAADAEPGRLTPQWSVTVQAGRRVWRWTVPPHRCVDPATSRSGVDAGCPWCRRHTLVLSVGTRADAADMTMSGSVVSARAGMVSAAVARVLRGSVRRLWVDVSHLLTIDQIGLHTLAGLRRAATAEQRAILLAHASPDSPVAAQFRRAGLLVT
jgi:STAS domain